MLLKKDWSPEKLRDREVLRKLALEFFARVHYRVVYVGEVCLWIRRYGLRETEDLLEEMVEGGLIRRARKAELEYFGCIHGYAHFDLKIPAPK